jgi:hypothetical protein
MTRFLLAFSFCLLLARGKSQTNLQLVNALSNAPVRCAVLDAQNHVINQANGFVIRKKNHFYFVTNYHIIEDTNYYSGIVHPFYDNGSIAEPTALSLKFRKKRDGSWGTQKIALFTNGKPNFFRMEFAGKKGDVMACRLEDSISFNYNPLDYYSLTGTKLSTGDSIYLVGYPISAGRNPAVRNGKVIQTDSIATTYQGKLPMILIDLSSPGWYSGSPAFYWNKESNKPILVGIIGNADEESNTAIWKISFLSELINSLP